MDQGSSSSRHVLNSPATEQTSPPSQTAQDDNGRGRVEERSASHYPLGRLDSFEKYEHRRLGLREALVSRVVADVMNPMRISQGAKTLDLYIRGGCPFLPTMMLNTEAQGPDMELELDLRLLEDMVHLVPADKPWRDWRLKMLKNRAVDIVACPPYQRPWTIGEKILDLVQRHYLEVDETATRQWFRIMRLPHGPTQQFRPKPPTSGELADPSRTASATPRTEPRRGTRAAATQSYEARRNHSRLEDRGGQHHVFDLCKHRESLDRFAKTQDGMHLYDGGASRSWNNQALDFGRSVTAHQVSMVGNAAMAPMWPHSRVLRRFKVRLSWKHRCKLDDPLFVTAHPPFRPTRGRGPFKYYAQNCRSQDRFSRDSPAPRQRSLSEPPAGMFAHAKLPRPAHHGPVLEMEIAYPPLSLSQIDRRSRRKSLDRENIEDMFGAAPIRGPGFLSHGQHIEDGSRIAEDGSYMGGLEDRIPSTVERRRDGTWKGPLLTHNVLWCHSCQIFQAMTGLQTLTIDSGPGEATYNSRPVGPILNPRQVEKNSGADPSRLRSKFPSLAFCTACTNCTAWGHSRTQCFLRCGHCGALGADVNPNDHHDHPALHQLLVRYPPAGLPARYHQADDCKVAKRNRCKCVTFPTFHTANDCTITCSRPCGNPWPPGHFKHRNAITCKFRCCMCGIRGHAGKECYLTKDTCLCGGRHLGQDCGWKAECRVAGCGRYHCRLH